MSARGFIGGEKAFNSHFLQGNILRRSEGCKSGKKPQHGAIPSVVEGQKWRGGTGNIQHVPAAGHLRITEQLFKERLHCHVRGISRNLAMHALNDACCDTLPIFDEWPEAFGMKYESDSVVWLHRIADREAPQEVSHSGIHPQRVPISVDDSSGVRLLLPQKQIHGLTRCLPLR